MQLAPASLRPTTVRVGVLVLALSDIVDSARSAADTIAPPAGRFVPAARTWTESEPQLCKDRVLEILEHTDDSQRRVLPG